MWHFLLLVLIHALITFSIMFPICMVIFRRRP